MVSPTLYKLSTSSTQVLTTTTLQLHYIIVIVTTIYCDTTRCTVVNAHLAYMVSQTSMLFIQTVQSNTARSHRICQANTPSYMC